MQCLAFTNSEIQQNQLDLRDKSIGERIAFWAEQFVGTPYDRDPQGAYVTRRAIVADDVVDCMYLIFRCTELAFSNTPQQAIDVALDKRFAGHGIIKHGEIIDYDKRFQYGEDMIASGKWGREITSQFGSLKKISGTRGQKYYYILPKDELEKSLDKFQTGDLLFFITNPQKRSQAHEIVGHLGIIQVEKNPESSQVYLISAHGSKQKGGAVEKVLLHSYLQTMPFIGVKITRF